MACFQEPTRQMLKEKRDHRRSHNRRYLSFVQTTACSLFFFSRPLIRTSSVSGRAVFVWDVDGEAEKVAERDLELNPGGESAVG